MKLSFLIGKSVIPAPRFHFDIILERKKRISFIGFLKNAGKTVLNIDMRFSKSTIMISPDVKQLHIKYGKRNIDFVSNA